MNTNSPLYAASWVRKAEQAMLRLDVERALALLANLPDLLASATPTERRAVLGSVVDKVWIANREVHAITPRAELYPLVASISRCVYGVADGTLFPHPHITRRPVALHHPRPLHGVGRAQAA